VLACPIAYVGEDGGLYLTSANGNAELRLTEPGWRVAGHTSIPICWSPCGRRLAFQASNARLQLAKDGQLLRRIHTTVPPQPGSVAAFRELGHR
jgi:hypothetical protein